MRGLAPGRRDQGEREQQRDEQPSDPEHDLQDDQAADVVVGAGRDRPSGVERDVRRERREDPEPLHRSETATCSFAVVGRRSTGRPASIALPVAVRSATSLRSCSSWARTRAVGLTGQRRLVVVAFDRRRLATVEQHVRALRHQRGDRSGIGLRSRANEQQLLDVALRERPLPGGELDDRA